MIRLLPLLVLALTAGAAVWIVWGSPNARPAAPVVRPVLFVPANLASSPDDLLNIDKAMQDVQVFFAGQLDGKTFHYGVPQTIQGAHELGFYCPRSKVANQCVQQLGVGPDPSDASKVLDDIDGQGLNGSGGSQALFIFWVGGYSFTMGALTTPDTGYVIMGDWALDSVGGRYAKGTANGGCREAALPQAQNLCQDNPSEIIHELGHLFGLPHPGPDGTNPSDPNYWKRSVMDHTFGCQWPDCKFLTSRANPEVQKLLNSPFIS